MTARTEADPVAVFLVTYGARGEKLLFRYPYESAMPKSDNKPEYRLNQFTMKSSLVVRYEVRERPGSVDGVDAPDGLLSCYTANDLANILVPTKPDFCGQKFEVKINDTFFVGFPIVLNVRKPSSDSMSPESERTDFIFNVAFGLRASATRDVISSYQELSKLLGQALCHEERRGGYLTNQKQMMLNLQDEFSANTDDDRPPIGLLYDKVLEACSLARCLKRIHDEICLSGTVEVYINNWVHVSLCLEPKMRELCSSSTFGGGGDCPVSIKPQILKKCIRAIRPYHSFLLLEDPPNLPLDASPALIKLIKSSSPVKNLQYLASENDIDLRQVVRAVATLVYWGRAMIIFPLCETNVYMVAPMANTDVNSRLSVHFSEQFPNLELSIVLSEFSFPAFLKDHRDTLDLQQGQDTKVVVWLLKHRLIFQQHTFVLLMPKDRCNSEHCVMKNSEDSQVNVESEDTISELSGHSSVTGSSNKPRYIRIGDLFPNLTPGERQNILNCPSASSEEDLKLLARLFKYFNGRHHLEAIMFFENLRRSTLVALIDKFRDVLFICSHDEADISYWIYSVNSM